MTSVRARGGVRFRAFSSHAVGFALPIFAGACLAASLPPIGLWPLAPIGAALLYVALDGTSVGGRAGRGFLTGLVQFAVGLLFISQFTLAGYLVAVPVESLSLAIGCALVPRGRLRPVGFVFALTLLEAARERWPFGGVPLASITLGQAGSPLEVLARSFGPLALATIVYALGAALGTAALARSAPQPLLRLGLAALAFSLMVGIVLVANTLPNSGATRATLRVAAVQGGGVRGLSAIEAPSIDATLRTLVESDRLRRGIALVLWPEDTLPLPAGEDARVVAELARRLHAAVVVGATKRIGARHFLNEMIEFAPDGKQVGAVEKVHPVPFGEYVPERGLLGHVVNLSAVPLDAIVGKSPEVLTASGIRIGVAISFEAFFPELARADVNAHALLILLPTNTASYKTAQVPAQELAAARLGAIATGRDILLDATTGYSALISRDGAVLQQSALGQPAIVSGEAALYDGRTLYDLVGSFPLELASAIVLIGVALSTRTRVRRVQRDSKGAYDSALDSSGDAPPSMASASAGRW